MKRFVAALLILSGLLVAGGANAVATLTFTESGGNVVVTFSGSINTTGLTQYGGGTDGLSPIIWPQSAFVALGYTGSSPILPAYWGLSGPTSWGTGGFTASTAASGDTVGLFINNGVHPGGEIVVPVGYTSGTTLNASATFPGTFTSLGLTPGTYSYTWGTGVNADSLNVSISSSPAPSAVPTLSEWTQLLLALMVITVVGWHFRREQNIS